MIIEYKANIDSQTHYTDRLKLHNHDKVHHL